MLCPGNKPESAWFLDRLRQNPAGRREFTANLPIKPAGMGYARMGGVKNVTFTVDPKSGAFVNTRLSAMHHSAESRVGFIEVGFACFVVAVLVGFALVIAG